MRYLLVVLYFVSLSCTAQIPGIIAASSRYFRVETPPVGQVFTYRQEMTVSDEDRIQKITVSIQPQMQDDLDDIRFVVDPSSTLAEKLYLPYWIESSDEDEAVIWVAMPYNVPETFYMLYGNENATAYSSGYRCFSFAELYFNDFSRGVDYDIVNTLGGRDECVSCDASGEETWPAGWQDPADKNHFGIIYKRQYSNIHAGNPRAHVAMKITSDGGETFGAEFKIDDPGAAYDGTSTTSISIPTTHPLSRTFFVQTGLPWQAGDLGQARASDTQYFDFSVTSYNSGTGELVVSSTNHFGTGTFASWDVTGRVGATNATITAVYVGDVMRLIMICSHVDYTITTGTATVGTKYSDDLGATWTDWTDIGLPGFVNVGGQAITMDNGYCVLSFHDGGVDDVWYAVTRDYGETFELEQITASGVNETGMFQIRDPETKEWTNQVYLTIRRETSTFHYYKSILTITESGITHTTPVESPFYVDEQSRCTHTRTEDGTIWGAFGDVREQMVYSKDEGETWHPIPYTTLEGSIYTSRRVYTIMFDLGNGRMKKYWSDNKLSGGADIFMNYWDYYRMALHPVSSATLTDTRTRPFDLSPGMRVNGSLVSGYRTTSTTSVAIPTSHPTSVSMTVSAGLSYQAGDAITITRNVSGGAQRFTGTVTAYSGTTLDFNSVANTNTGTFADWVIDKTSNFLSDQVFVSTWNRNGYTSPFRLETTVKSPSLGGGFFGLKKDETRALGVVTVNDVGSPGDTVEIKWSSTSTYNGLFTGISKIAWTIVDIEDDIQDIVNELVTSANEIGVCPVSTSDATSITFMAPRGENTFTNGRALTVRVVGDADVTAANFSSGAQTESSTTLSNIIHFDVGNNVVRIEQANDNHNQAFTAAKNVNVDYSVTWTPTLVTMTDGTTTRTKGPATGSGVPNWDGHIYLSLSTTATSPQGFHENYRIITKPETDPIATPGAISTGEWEEREDGLGINGDVRDYVAFPDAPSFTDTHTMVQATTGTGIQIGDTGGKTEFYVQGNYSFMQFNIVNDDNYRLMSYNNGDPSNWSKIGSPSPQDYAIDEVNAAHGYSFYRLWFNETDNQIKKRPFDALGTLSPILFENCIFTDAGFGSVLINQSISGRDYGKFTASYLSFTGTGAERFYLGNTGNATTKYTDTTSISHIYSDSSRREVVQLNNHRYVRVSNVTGRHVGIVLESPDQGIGQKNFMQCQGCGGGYIENSIGESVAPMMIASTSLDIRNNRITWSTTNRQIYLQDLVGNGYAYKNVDDDTVFIEHNDFICPGYSLSNVIRVQEDDLVVVIRYNRFPPSATNVYTCDGPCPTIISYANTFDSDDVPPVTFGPHPDPAYAPYWKVVTSEYDYLKGRGALTPEP